jgi:hypothetical protein
VADAIIEMDDGGMDEDLARRISEAVKAVIEARGEL